mgnify:CR=1 FL=1
MLRSVLVVAASVCDITLSLHHALSPEVAPWAVGASLVAATAGCLWMATALSRTMVGLELPVARTQGGDAKPG